MKLKIVRNIDKNGLLHLALTGGMTVYSSAKLKDILLKELKSNKGIVMDLAEVDEADTSGFQLLLFLKRESELLGKSFIITSTSRRLTSILTLYREMI